MMKLDLRRLRFLREFEERGTLAAVAAALGYSPSTVSQQLALVERKSAPDCSPRPAAVCGSPTPERSTGYQRVLRVAARGGPVLLISPRRGRLLRPAAGAGPTPGRQVDSCSALVASSSAS
jgi:hypothetical protein